MQVHELRPQALQVTYPLFPTSASVSLLCQTSTDQLTSSSSLFRRWGFRQVERNVSGDTVFMHNSFQRKDKSLCQQMRSVVKKQTATAFIKQAPIAHGGMMVDPNYAMLMCQQMAMNPMLAMTMMSGGGMNPAMMNQSLMGQALNGMNNGMNQNSQQGQGFMMPMGGNNNFNGMNQQPNKREPAMQNIKSEDHQGAMRGNSIPPRQQNELDFQSNMPSRMMGNNPQMEMIEARLRLEKLEQQQELEHQRAQRLVGMFQQDGRGGNPGNGLMNGRQPNESDGVVPNRNQAEALLKAMQTERLHQQSIGGGRGMNESMGPNAMNMMQQMGQSHHMARPGQDMQRPMVDDRRSHPPTESIGNGGGMRGGFQGVRDGGGNMGAVDEFQRYQRMQQQFMMMQGAYMGQQGSPGN